MILEGVQKYKICLRYPIPKSLPSGKGLAIASLKCFTLIVILSVAKDLHPKDASLCSA